MRRRSDSEPRVVAILAVRNERPYLRNCLGHLIDNGIDFFIVDNESTDGTAALLREPRFAEYLVGQRRSTFRGAFDWAGLLRAREEAASGIEADWVVFVSADEIMHSYSAGESLAAAIARADADGYDVIDFNEYVFLPVNVDYVVDCPGWQPLRHYYFFEPSRPRLMRARRRDLRVSHVTTGGHVLEGELLQALSGELRTPPLHRPRPGPRLQEVHHPRVPTRRDCPWMACGAQRSAGRELRPPARRRVGVRRHARRPQPEPCSSPEGSTTGCGGGEALIGLGSWWIARRGQGGSMRVIKYGLVTAAVQLGSLLPAGLHAQALEPTSPEDVGLSAARLVRVDALAERLVERREIAGAVVLVARRGQLAHLGSYGHLDREAGVMQEDAIFRICSMSKTITSLARHDTLRGRAFPTGTTRWRASSPSSSGHRSWSRRPKAPSSRTAWCPLSAPSRSATCSPTPPGSATDSSASHRRGSLRGSRDHGRLGRRRDLDLAGERAPLLQQPGERLGLRSEHRCPGPRRRGRIRQIAHRSFSKRASSSRCACRTRASWCRRRSSIGSTSIYRTDRDGRGSRSCQKALSRRAMWSSPRPIPTGARGATSRAGPDSSPPPRTTRASPRCVLNGGELDGVRLLVAARPSSCMTTDHITRVAENPGHGFGLGLALAARPRAARARSRVRGRGSGAAFTPPASGSTRARSSSA